MVVQLVARLFELISQCWASLSELTERELDKMAYIVEYSCLSVIDLPANLIRGALILKKELEFRWRFFFFVSFRIMKWKESKDAVFFNVERSFVGKKFWRRRASIFLRINEELTSKWKRSIDRDLLMVTGGDVCVFIHRVCVYTYVYLICVNDFVTRDANCL